MSGVRGAGRPPRSLLVPRFTLQWLEGTISFYSNGFPQEFARAEVYLAMAGRGLVTRLVRRREKKGKEKSPRKRALLTSLGLFSFLFFLTGLLASLFILTGLFLFFFS